MYNDDLPALTGAKTFLLTRAGAQRILDAIRRRLPKVAGGSVEVEGPDGPMKLRLQIRRAEDGCTIDLVPSTDDESSSSPSSVSDSSSGSDDDSGSPSNSEEPSNDSGSDDSKTAIVKFRGGNIGWVCEEQPEPMFSDVLVIPLGGATKQGRTVRVEIAPEHLECCEPGSLHVVSALCDRPELVSARIDGKFLTVERGGTRANFATIKIQGVRLGHAGRWKRYSNKQKWANREFYKMAHDPSAWL